MMEKTYEEPHEYVAGGVKRHAKGVTWSFPITDMKPTAFTIELRRTGDKTGADALAVTISGLADTHNPMPDYYFGDKTKDPILHALAKRMLDAVDQEANTTVRLTRIGRDGKAKGFCIHRNDNNDANSSIFQLSDMFSNSFFGRSYKKADAEKLYVKLEKLIDEMTPEIEAAVEQAAANRRPLVRHGKPVPPAANREIAWLERLDAQLDEQMNAKAHPRINTNGGWDKDRS